VSAAQADPLWVIAEYMQAAPGTTGNFRIFSNVNGYSPAISGNNVAFGSSTDGGGGIYALIDGRLRLIADTNTHMPGTETHFGFGLFYGSGPSISGNNVVFAAPALGEGDAIWAWFDGVYTKIAGTDTPVPGGAGTFMTFGTGNGATPSISGQNVAFLGLSDQSEILGIYAYINGELRVIADTNTLLPGATQTVTDFGFLKGTSPAISGENVAFFAQWGFDGQGIYAYINGEIRVIADTGTPIPDGGALFCGDTFGVASLSPSISGENVAFSNGCGIYAYINGSLRLIVDKGTVPPGATGPFTNFGSSGGAIPSISGENVAFGAYATGIEWGVFALIDGSLRLIASVDTPVPGLEGTTFNHFGLLNGTSPAIDGQKVVFMGNPAPGIYVNADLGQLPTIPAVSAWGLVVLALLTLIAGTILCRPRRVAA
jgi:hypothetical protein